MALTQGWDLNRKDTKPIIEIRTKSIFLDLRLEVLMGSRNNSYVAGDGLNTTYSLIGLFLQNAQELNLHREWHIANFV